MCQLRISSESPSAINLCLISTQLIVDLMSRTAILESILLRRIADISQIPATHISYSLSAYQIGHWIGYLLADE